MRLTLSVKYEALTVQVIFHFILDVYDSMVNQLLTCIDGVVKLNNILVIAMTNRRELLDPALLRAGRIEIHTEVGLPNRQGRLQIFSIHTRKY